MSARPTNIAPVRRALAYAPSRRSFLSRAVAALVGGTVLVGRPRRAIASSQPFVGEIMLTASFAPAGWHVCDGTLLSIANYTDLWSILGTTYGGDGQTTFALPDLRGRAAMHVGEGLGLAPRFLGEVGGQEAEVVSVNQMPNHDHAAIAGSANGTSPIPTGLYPAPNPAGNLMYGPGADTQLGETTTPAGAGQSHPNMQPFLTLNYCIALTGIYPSRS